MENKKIESIMYGKFPGRNERRGTLLIGNKNGVVVIDKPFKQVFKEEVEKEVVKPQPRITVADSDTEVVLLWQGAIHKNHIKIRGGK